MNALDSKKLGACLFALSLAAGCGEVIDADEDIEGEIHLDSVDGADEGHLYQGLAAAGPWDLPREVERIGEEQRVSYDSAPAWNGGANCSGGITPGAAMLRDHLLRYFPQVSHIGGYVCREVRGAPGVMSVHGTGRALDVFIPTIDGSADNTKGDEIGNWLVQNAHAMGIQSVIWDRTIWRVDHDPRDYDYTGLHPHNDHLHVELTVEASHRDAPWYKSPFGPESCDPIPSGEATVVSETGVCFARKGNADLWRKESGSGHGGELFATQALSRDKASTLAQWSLPMKKRGEYRIEVFIDGELGRFKQARYQVRAGGLSYFPVIDQGAASGWTRLGAYLFEEGEGQFVRLYNNSKDPIDGATRIVADAIRVVPVSVDGCERLPAEGGVIRETSPCFHREGPNKGWHTKAGEGHGGSLLFMSAQQGTAPRHTAEWRVLVSNAGRYEISVFLDPTIARFDATKYKVVASGETFPARIDQSTADGFTSLGVFDLGGGSEQLVRVSDTSPDPVPEGGARIAVDAIRLLPAP
jgi:hypothetical protein